VLKKRREIYRNPSKVSEVLHYTSTGEQCRKDGVKTTNQTNKQIGRHTQRNKQTHNQTTCCVLQVNAAEDLVNLRRANITFTFVSADTECDIGKGLYELVELNAIADAFIGTCVTVATVVALCWV